MELKKYLKLVCLILCLTNLSSCFWTRQGMHINKKYFLAENLNIFQKNAEISYHSIFDREIIFKHRELEMKSDQSEEYITLQFRQLNEIYNQRQIGYKGLINPEVDCGAFAFSGLERLGSSGNLRARFDYYSNDRMVPGACADLKSRRVTSLQWIYCHNESKLHIFKIQNSVWGQLESISYEFNCND